MSLTSDPQKILRQLEWCRGRTLLQRLRDLPRRQVDRGVARIEDFNPIRGAAEVVGQSVTVAGKEFGNDLVRSQ